MAVGIMLFLLVFFTAGLQPLFAGGKQNFRGLAYKVKDGDSLVAVSGGNHYEIRLYGIDAPEYRQPGGREAHRWLQENLVGKLIDIGVTGRDRYDRLVAIVSQEGLVINEELVRLGLAQVYPKYCQRKICRHWVEQEKDAWQKHLGIWGQKHPVAPWTWRHHHKRS